MIARLHLRTIPQLAVLVALFVVGAATRAGAQASPQNSQVYDCGDLIREQEIDRVIGQSGTKLAFSSRDAQDPSVPGYTECDYDLPGGVVLGVAVFTGAARENIDQAWTLSQGAGAKAISGIGESALLADAPGGRIILVRVRGGRGVRVNAGDVEGSGRLDLDEVIKRVAAIVVPRI